jgi:transposase InsO family protein
MQNELLNDHGPFETIEALQAALDVWRDEYNTDRPHQSLDMPSPRPGSSLPCQARSCECPPVRAWPRTRRCLA